MKIRPSFHRFLAGLLVYVGLSLQATAQTATWNSTGTGLWTETAKWNWTGTVPGTALPDAATSIVLSNGGTISLKDSTQSILGLTMNNGRLEVTKESTAGILGLGGTVVFGSNSGTNSSVLVDGLGSELNKTGVTQMHLGSSGSATMTVSNQGKVTSSGTIHVGLGNSASVGTGVLNVNTQGQLITTSTFILGYRGNGSMNVESGGFVKSPNGFIAGYGQDSNRVQGTAAVKVSGTGSKWEVGILYVGHTGTGSMTVEDNGVVAGSSTAAIGFYNAGNATGATGPPPLTKYGTGTVTVKTGGQWQSTLLNIGTTGGTGTLNVASQGRVNVGGGTGTITVGSTGVMNIGGDPLLDAAPSAPGIVFAGSISGGGFYGAALNLYHNDLSGNYHLTKSGLSNGEHVALTSTLNLNVLSGSTTLIGANSFSGAIMVGGLAETPARLVARHSQALGSGQITVKENGTLEIAPTLSMALMGTLSLEGGSALSLKVNPAGGEFAPRLNLSGWLDALVNEGEKITLYLSGGSAIENPELYDWTFLTAQQGIYVDVTNLFEVVSDVPGFYVFQRDDSLVLGMTSLVPEPGRLFLCGLGLSCLVLRRRRGGI
jgi:T5SS/PEP-CTERM-associated repeat protein